MKKGEQERKTDELILSTHDALQTVYDALNKGQRQKLEKDEKIAALLDRYAVEREIE